MTVFDFLLDSLRQDSMWPFWAGVAVLAVIAVDEAAVHFRLIARTRWGWDI